MPMLTRALVKLGILWNSCSIYNHLTIIVVQVRTCDAETGSPRKTQHVHLRMRPARSGRSRLCTVTGDSVSGCPGAGGSCSLRLPSTYSASVYSAAILPTSGCIVQSNYSPGGGGSGVQEFFLFSCFLHVLCYFQHF